MSQTVSTERPTYPNVQKLVVLAGIAAAILAAFAAGDIDTVMSLFDDDIEGPAGR